MVGLGRSLDELLQAIASTLGRSLSEESRALACPFPDALPEREIALLSIAGPSEGGVVVMPEGDLVTRLGASARSDRVWDREIASTAALLGLAEEVRGVCREHLCLRGSYQVASPVVVSGDRLSVRSRERCQLAYRVDPCEQGDAPVSILLAGWLGGSQNKATTTAERLAGLDELRDELLARRGAG